MVVLNSGHLQIDIAPTVSAYFNRGRANLEIDYYDRAIQDFNEVILLEPKNASAHNNRGNSYSHKGQYDRAIEDYQTALRIDPTLHAARENLEKILERKNQ